MSQPPADLARLTPEQRDLLLRRVRERRGQEPARKGIEARRDRAAPAPLSFAQQRLWFLDQLQPGSAAYNISVAVEITGRLQVRLLCATVDTLIRRHESLRTTFQLREGQAVQVVSPPSGDPASALPVVDLSGLDPLVRDALAAALCNQEMARPFDLSRGPLLRPVLFRVAGERYALSLVFHHIISDLWSIGVFVREMTSVYSALETGQAATLPELPVQYADYALWQREELRGERLEQEVEHWRRELEGAPVSLDLPADHPRGPVLDPRGDSLLWHLPAGATGRLRELGDAGGATLFMALLAAFSVLLARLSGQQDLVVGSPVSNRPRVELEGLVGFFVNLLVLRADLKGAPDFLELLERVKGRCLRALAHQDLPFEQLVDDLKLERDLSQPPLVQAVLALQNISLPNVERPGLRFDPVRLEVDTTKFDLSLELQESGGGLSGNWGYRVALFERPTVERIGRCFTVLLEGLAARPDLPVWELPLLDESERHQVLREGRRGRPEPARESLPARVARVARRTPDAAAVAGPGGEALSYGELTARADRVAAGLRSLGVGAEARVAIVLERSPELVVALLGVLSAGGACLLLDPGRERSWLERMLERSGCAAVLTRAGLLGHLPEHGGVEALLERLETAEPMSETLAGIDPESLAFVVQAEPGRQPRLAGLSHRSVAAWVEAWGRRLGPEDLRAVSCDSSLETSDGVLDLMMPLCLGGCLALGGAPSLRSAAAGAAEVLDGFSSTLGGVWPAEELNARVLGWSGEPVPLGVAGDLWLAGEGLARGYEGDAARTAERFVPDPFGDRPGSRRVHTGYRARWRPDGRLEILGTVERRVWVRGLPLDLGRIEKLLTAHPGVLHAVASLQAEGGGTRLVAHVLGSSPGAPTPDELKSFLRSRLPEPLVPWGIAVLEELPRTRTGSVDPEALPRIEPGTPRDHDSPHSEVEAMLAGIWSELLQVEAVGLQDNFFQLGGDSILALQVVARVRQAGWAMTPRQLFANQTVAGLARVIGRLPVQTEELEEAASSGPVPLTPIQRWFFDQDFVRPAHWNQSVLLATRRALETRALERALGAVAACHGALRLRFRREEAGWVQWIDPPGPLVPAWVDLTALPAGRRVPALEEAACGLQASLDLEGPVTRFTLFRLGGGEADRLLWITHHLAVDAVSWRVLLSDLEIAYGQAEEGREPRLSPEPASFRRWAGELAGHRHDPRLERVKEIWTDLVARTQPDPPALRGGREGEAERVVVSLPEEETRSLLRRAQGPEGVRIDELLLTALLAGWREWTGQGTLYLHLEGHGRDDPFGDTDLSRTVGWLTTLTPVLLEAAGQEDLEAMLARVGERLRSLPGGVELGLAAESLPPLPRPPILFNNLGQLDQALSRDTLWAPAAESPGPSRDPAERRSYPLELNAGIVQGRFHLELRSGRGQSLQGLADAFLAALRNLIERHRPGPALPLAPLQSGILFHSLLSPESGVYVTQLSCLLRGKLDLEAFSSAWRRLIERHSALRTRFAWEGLAKPVQMEEPEVDLPLDVEDWSDLPSGEQERRWGELLREDRRRGFVLSRAPLLRLRLVRLAPDTHRFLWSLHHLLSDGWSLAILMREGFALYEAAVRGTGLHLPAPPPYQDYARWLEEHPPERSEDFWRRVLAGFREPTPIRLGPGPAAAAQDPDPAERPLLLSAETSGALRGLARRCQATLYTVMSGAFALLLRRLSGSGDVVFGTVVSGRPSTLEGMEHRVGCFINTLPTRVSTGGSLPLASWLRALHTRWLETEEHQHTPLADVTAWSEIDPGKPLFSSILVFENYPVQRSAGEWGGGLAIEDLRVHERTNYPLSLLVVPGERILLHAQFDRRSVHPAAVQGAMLCLEALLEAMATDPEARLPDLPLLTPQERHQLLVEWPDVRRPPEEPGDGRLTAWARKLRARGAGPGSPVCVLLEPGPELEAARLAVGMAGSVCLLLSPADRLERLLSLLYDSGGTVLLTSPSWASRLRGEVGGVTILETGEDESSAGEEIPEAGPAASFLLGAAVPARGGTRSYLLDSGLDSSLAPVPVWGLGELYLGGEGLEQGFWHQPGLTAGRFLPDPFAEEPGARLYRTGDRFQQLPDGGLRPVLPEAAAEAAADSAPLPPRDETERKLAAIWEDLLGTAGIGVRDNFFARGGHSLLALRLMSRIEEDLGADLPLNALFQAPTIEGLAARISAHQDRPREEVLVPLQPQGEDPPLFFVHPAGGSVFCYQSLAGRLGTGQPFYGLQAAEDGGEATIEEMAARYLEAVRGVQPRGPYHLGGWSLGGVIAFEMARQLWAAGEKVPLLALVDAPPAAGQDVRPADPPDGGAWFLQFAADLAGLQGLGASMPAGEILALEPEARLAWLHAYAQDQGAIPSDLSLSRFRRRFELFQRNVRALAGYTPGAMPGSLLFIHCGEVEGDPSRGWSRYAAEATAHVLEADHYTVLREPHVAELARLLQAAIRESPALAGCAVSPAA